MQVTREHGRLEYYRCSKYWKCSKHTFAPVWRLFIVTIPNARSILKLTAAQFVNDLPVATLPRLQRCTPANVIRILLVHAVV